MKTQNRKIALLLFLATGTGVCNAQNVDSVANGQVYVPSETISIVDTTTSVVSNDRSSYNMRTETIRVYSGSHNGNNLIRTYEVPIKSKDEQY